MRLCASCPTAPLLPSLTCLPPPPTRALQREKKDLTQLSHLGHFLKGSSAALGVNKVRTVCEKIQHYGLLWDDENHKDLSQQEALDLVTPLLPIGKKGYAEAEKWLKNWFKEQGVSPPTEDAA